MGYIGIILAVCAVMVFVVSYYLNPAHTVQYLRNIMRRMLQHPILLLVLGCCVIFGIALYVPALEIHVNYASGDIGISNTVCLTGYSITDADGKTVTETFRQGAVWKGEKYRDVAINLYNSGLNLKKPFSSVTLEFDVTRKWGPAYCHSRTDKITLDATDSIQHVWKQKNDDGKCRFVFKVSHTYTVGKSDALKIQDIKGNDLICLKPTRETGLHTLNAPSP